MFTLSLAQAAVLGVHPFHPGWETYDSFNRRSAFFERAFTEHLLASRAWSELAAEYRAIMEN